MPPGSNPVADRAARLRALAEREWDLLIVGGGITGCGIARDAALRGLKVALVEKNDFASGTSSRSSRLVHGGIRYLEHGDIHLVFEASIERRRLLQLAPHLVRPLAFTWPVYRGARISRWKLEAGLWAYDALALFRNVKRHQRLSTAQVLAREPGLRPTSLVGGARYYDAHTNDARLTLANAIGAAEAGAVLVNHVAAIGLIRRRDRVAGAVVRDAFTADTIEVRARVVVNAAGPWSDDVRGFDRESGAAVRGSKGVHIAVPRDRVGNSDALTLLSPRDGRVMFVLPSGTEAIIGTTDTYTAASPDDVRAASSDIQYLLDSTNAFFPRAELRRDDVISAWAGIRPLVPEAGSTPGAVSREHAVATSESGLLSITGGKLTTYRVMAHDVLDAVAHSLPRAIGGDRTTRVPLPGGERRDVDALARECADETGDEQLAEHLVAAFGTRWRGVWQEIERPGGNERLLIGRPYTVGELRYAVRAEMACTLADLLIRRMPVAFETRDHGVAVAAAAADAVGPILGWDGAARSSAVAAYKAEAERVFGIEP